MRVLLLALTMTVALFFARRAEASDLFTPSNDARLRVNSEAALASSILGGACELGSARSVSDGVSDGEDPAPAAAGLADGGRTGLRGMSLRAHLPVSEEDQGCIDRVATEEVDRDPVPVAFDGGELDPMSAFASFEPAIRSFFQGELAAMQTAAVSLTGQAFLLERPPRLA